MSSPYPPLPAITPRQFIDEPRCLYKDKFGKLCGAEKLLVGDIRFCKTHDAAALAVMRQNGKLT